MGMTFSSQRMKETIGENLVRFKGEESPVDQHISAWRHRVFRSLETSVGAGAPSLTLTVKNLLIRISFSLQLRPPSSLRSPPKGILAKMVLISVNSSVCKLVPISRGQIELKSKWTDEKVVILQEGRKLCLDTFVKKYLSFVGKGPRHRQTDGLVIVCWKT